VVTLDGLNDPNPMLLLQASSALVTASNTYFNLINGAKAENILLALGTAATLGASSVLEGSNLAGTAITFGTKSELHGCALTQSALTLESEGSVELDHYDRKKRPSVDSWLVCDVDVAYRIAVRQNSVREVPMGRSSHKCN
jgi:hypothetical protein